jgi:hypothetical protein
MKVGLLTHLVSARNTNLDDLVIEPNLPSHIGPFKFGVKYTTSNCIDHQDKIDLISGTVLFECGFIAWKPYDLASTTITIMRGESFSNDLTRELKNDASGASWSTDNGTGCTYATITPSPVLSWMTLA